MYDGSNALSLLSYVQGIKTKTCTTKILKYTSRFQYNRMNRTWLTYNAISLCTIQFITELLNFRVLLNQCLRSSTISHRTMEGKKDIDEKKDSKVEESLDSSDDQVESASGEDLDSGMDRIRKFFEQKLHLFDSSSAEPSGEKILTEASLDGIADFIKKNNITKVITMAGAGISTSAGIPDFRSPKSGLYHNLEKYNLPHPQAIFELDFFRQNPEPFFVLAKELLPEGYKPTPAHYFIKLLHDKGLLLRHYTQNIDTLERMTGLPEEKIVEAHGTFYTGHCLECHDEYDLNWMKEKIKDTTVPKCEKCNDAVVKPDIVFFGEMLPDRFHILIDKDFPKAELLIIMGSSLIVQPFASLVERVKDDCPRLLINMEKVGVQDRIMRMLGLGGGMNFESANARDVAWLGECDKGIQLLAEKLGWGDELKDLITKEHERLEKEFAEAESAAPKKDSHSGTEKASKIK